jgi:alpha-tubulin suppressor-like RCC1 family protein
MNDNVWTIRLIPALLCAVALTLAACGGSGDAAPPPMIGAAGGTVTGPNGAQVVVPAGALAANTAIAVDQSSAGSPALPIGMNAFGAMFAFTPHGTSFAAPVTVTLPFNAASVPAGVTPALFKTNAAGAWERVAGATLNAATATAQVTSFSFLLVGSLPPQITTQPADAAVLEPATASFSVTAIGTPPFSYQWQRSDDAGATFNDVAGATAASYTTGATSVAADSGDRYRVRVSNADGPSISASATLTVTANVVAPTISTQPQNQSVAVGGSASFSVLASGTNLVYQWQKNGAALAGQTNASLNLANVQAGDAGSYTVVVSNLVNGASINGITSNPATLTVTTAPPATGVARIAAGSEFSLARRANGDLYSWGSDTAGTLGAGNGDQSRNVPGLVSTSNIAAIAAGAAHGLAVRGTGEVRGWGYNGFGQLGNGSFSTAEAPVSATVDPAGTLQYSDAVEVCGGELHSLVRRSGGAVHAMGYNNEGQLGDGTTSMIGRSRGLAVPGITTAIAIACRGRHSLALLADGTVRAWGGNSAGQLGDGTTANRSTPVLVAGLTNVIAIAAGDDHSLALRSDGSVWAWGSNVNGKLGDGSVINRLTPTATLLTSGITAIAAGTMNSVALRNDGVVLAWGINETGQLGSGSLTPGFRPQPAPVINLPGVVAIAFSSGGLSHGLAVKSDGTVWAWGDNMKGQLGNGSTAPFSATPVQVTGLNLN